MSHDIGDLVRLWQLFSDESGVQTSPTTVTLTIRKPDGTVEEVDNEAGAEGDLSIASDALGVTLTVATGLYKAVVDVDQPGRWYYRWVGTGAVEEAGEGWFGVRYRRVPEPES